MSSANNHTRIQLAKRTVTGETNWAIFNGSDHFNSSLAECWRSLELSGFNRNKTK
jgi:hypothetical protein